jgi:aminotransferase EvaB
MPDFHVSQMPMNDLNRAIHEDRQALDRAIASVLDSGWLIHGKHHAAFEQEFASYLRVKECIGVANGTDALTVALAVLGVQAGDRVITVANAGFYASTACTSLGATPHYVDIDPDTLTMSPRALQEALEHNPAAVVVTHLYGGLAHISQIAALCRDAGVPLIEDCAQATGSVTGDGRRAGTIGDVGCFSFYPTKNLAAIGDGGAIVTNSPQLADNCKMTRQYGWSLRYTVQQEGMNSRLDELQAAVLRYRLTRLDERNQRRRAIASTYAEALSTNTVARIIFQNSPAHVAHLAVIRTPYRDALREHLSYSGVPSDVHYPIPDDAQPIWKSLPRNHPPEHLTETHAACSEVLSVPCFPEMTPKEIETVADALRTFIPPSGTTTT